MADVTINVAQDFSRYPSGRFRTDSRYSGEEFRDDYILPALEQGGKVIVDLDGTLGYGSSFLDEAFGGLVRLGRFANGTLLRLLEIRTSNPILKAEVESYLR